MKLRLEKTTNRTVASKALRASEKTYRYVHMMSAENGADGGIWLWRNQKTEADRLDSILARTISEHIFSYPNYHRIIYTPANLE